MSTYGSTDIDIEGVDSGTEQQSQRKRKDAAKGKAYNVQLYINCITAQTRITKQINKIDLAVTSYDNCHNFSYNNKNNNTLFKLLKSHQQCCWY